MIAELVDAVRAQLRKESGDRLRDVYAATQDETTITVRADIAFGVLLSWIGWTILAIAGAFWTWRSLRARRRAVRA